MGATQLDLTAMSEAPWIAAPVSDLIVNCQKLDGGGCEVAAEVLDNQAQDVEQNVFKKTTRFSLADIPCVESR